MPRGRKLISIDNMEDNSAAETCVHSAMMGFPPDPDADLAEMMALRGIYDSAMNKANTKPQLATNHAQYTILQPAGALKQRMKLARKLRARTLGNRTQPQLNSNHGSC